MSSSPHRKKRLSADAKVILALLKKQPQERDELCKNASISISMSYQILPFLESRGIVKETPSGYALRDYIDTEEAVMQTIKQWRKLAFRDPNPTEIADDMPISPHEAETLARKTKEKTGWTMPNEAVKQSAAEKLGEVLICAARKRNGTISNFDYEKYPDDPEILEEAERFVKEHPKMLPKLTEDEEHISWPQEALRYLPINHKPKDRHITTLIVVNSRK